MEDQAAKASSNRERNQARADSAKIAAQHAAASAKSAIDEVLRLCGHGRNHGKGGKSSGDKDDIVVLKFKSLIEEDEAKNPRGVSGYAARRALQEHFLTSGARRNLTRLTLKVALEVKLLASGVAQNFSFAEIR